MGDSARRILYFCMIRWIWYTTPTRWTKHLIVSVLFAELLDLERFHIFIITDDSVIHQLKWENTFTFFSLVSFFNIFLFYVSLDHLCSALSRNQRSAMSVRNRLNIKLRNCLVFFKVILKFRTVNLRREVSNSVLNWGWLLTVIVPIDKIKKFTKFWSFLRLNLSHPLEHSIKFWWISIFGLIKINLNELKSCSLFFIIINWKFI